MYMLKYYTTPEGKEKAALVNWNGREEKLVDDDLDAAPCRTASPEDLKAYAAAWRKWGRSRSEDGEYTDPLPEIVTRFHLGHD